MTHNACPPLVRVSLSFKIMYVVAAHSALYIVKAGGRSAKRQTE